MAGGCESLCVFADLIAEQSLFKGDTFACRREPTRRIPISHVNDNYCDCNDGSDEPGM